LPHFERYIGIDYSGAETPESRCRGLRVYAADGSGTPEPVQPLHGPRRDLPSEVFLGRSDQLVVHQNRTRGR
jgi:hypothetical protein